MSGTIRRRVVPFVGLALCAGLAAGAAADKVTITLAGGTTDNIKAMLPVFEKMYPDINVVYSPGTDDFNQKMLVEFAAGAGPDVFLMDIPTVPTYNKEGFAWDLRELAKSYDVGIDNFSPFALKIFTKEGKTYALPKGFTPIVSYYNKTMFTQRGLSFPQYGWTYDDYFADGKKLTQDKNGDGKTDVWGINYNIWSGYNLPELWAWGSDILDPKGTTAKGYTNSAKTREYLEAVKGWMTSGVAAPPGVDADFLKGHSAMRSSGHWYMYSLRDNLEKGTYDIGVMPLPMGPYATEPTTVIYATGWAISKQTKHVKEALDLVKFLSGPIYMKKEALDTLVEIPGNKTAMQQMLQADKFGIENDIVYASQFGRQPWSNRIAGWDQIEDKVWSAAATNVLSKNAPVANELEKAAGLYDAWLADNVDKK